VKLKIIILILFVNYLNAQNYQKDWSTLKSKIEVGTSISRGEAEALLLNTPIN